MPEKKKSNTPHGSRELRSLAEKRLTQKRLASGVSALNTMSSPEEMNRLVHDLQVHQLELEIQHEELRRTRVELENSLSMFTELYDFAPTGYVTLGRDSKILQANLTASSLLGVDRSRLLGMHFIHYVVPADYRVIDALLEKVFSEKVSASCEVNLLPSASNSFRVPSPQSLRAVHIEAAVSDTVHACRVILLDITEQKRIEKKLLENKTRFSQALKAASAGVWEWDLKTGENFWSEELWSLYGLKKGSEKPSFKLWADSIHPDEREKVIQTVSTAADDAQELYAEYRVCYPDGSVHWIMSRGQPLCNEKGETTRYIGTVIDITEKKQTEEALKISKERFKTLFDDHTSIMLVIDPVTRNIVAANHSAAAFYGWSTEELQLMKAEEISLSSMDNLQDDVTKISSSELNRITRKHKRADGSIRDVEITINLIVIDGKELFYAVINDITERLLVENELKDSEERFRKLFEGHSAIMLLLDPATGKIMDANRAASDFYGWTHEELCNMHMSQINTLLPEEIDLVMAKWKSAEKLSFLFTHRKADGTLCDIEAFGCKIIIKDKAVVYVIIHDITDRILAAEESDRLKSAFLANISHEIRAPMNGIMGFSELLKEPHLTGEEQAEYLGLIQQSGNRLLKLINELIDISRYDAGETKPQIAETSINALLHDLYAFFKPETEKKGLCLNCTCELSDEECIIETDSGKLTQILTNLIHNALKFTNTGTIDFGYTKTGSALSFYVLDTGIGVPVDMQQKIFERFRQVDNSLNRNHQGSGLGLSISKAYVEMLGGTIHVESREGQGSKFFFTLPYNWAGSTNMQPSSSVIQKPVKIPPDMTILIAEDDEVCRLLLQKSLKDENVKILYAFNGKEAVELVKCHPEITLVLMDIKMPIMNGYDATRLIKQQRPDLPVIAQSAFTSQKEREKAIEAGCDSFIAKPIYKSELLEVIQWETTMQSTLQAVANVAEAHDPYTAGHERRVGIIAADIAREMGWSEEKCQTLQFIGLVHDIGKMSIPAAILAKPGQLSAIEFELVKTHAEQGYQILKDIDFSLPIARIIREHHERMDGSGYPHGLKGEEILIESRILAVADVLEAMASHRPYRASLGIEEALKEIERYRVQHFDPEVVDAVFRLFREKDYQLPD